jgi:predicted Zn-dependent protease
MPKEFLPLVPEKMRFKDQSTDGPSPDELDEEIEDVNARSWAHLGSLLLLRSRPSAALIELGKAEARVGARSPSLSNAYARTLLAAGRVAEAERVLRASLVPYPDVAQTHLRLAEIEIAASHWDQAAHELTAANGIDPFDPAIHVGLLRIARETKDPKAEARETAALVLLQKT